MADSSTRDRVLDAAAEVTREVGLRELTLARVADRAGVSRQAVYLHFGNRATLLLQMARRLDRASGFVGRLMGTRALDPVLAFRRMLEEWLDYVPLILPIARALEAAVVGGDEGADAYQDRMSDWRAAIRVAMERLERGGHLSPDWDVDSASDWLWACVLPAVYDHLVNVRGWSHEQMVSRTIASLENELLTRERDSALVPPTSR